MNPNTKTDDREQWRARIQRALMELQGEIPGLIINNGGAGSSSEEQQSDGSSSSAEV